MRQLLRCVLVAPLLLVRILGSHLTSTLCLLFCCAKQAIIIEAGTGIHVLGLSVVLFLWCAQVAAGGTHSLAVTSTGRMFIWGRASYGRLGLGSGGKDCYSPVEAALPGGHERWKIAAATAGDCSARSTVIHCAVT